MTRVADRLELPVHYLQSGRIRKEDVAKRMLAERPRRSGAICLLSIVEPCSSWQVRRSREHLHPQQVRRRLTKCLHHYHYFLDRELGFCHVCVQTWMPYTVQLCINGREWLGRQLDSARPRYTRSDSCFPHLGSPDRVQEIMDRMLTLSWSSILGDLVDRANPARQSIRDAVGSDFYWTVHQVESATDVMFQDPAILARSHPALVVRRSATSSAVMSCASSPSPRHRATAARSRPNYKRRLEGVRVMHAAKANSVKMSTRPAPCCASRRRSTSPESSRCAAAPGAIATASADPDRCARAS